MKRHIETDIDGCLLRGYLEYPEDPPGPYPLLVMFHGFTGDCTETNFLFARLARMLCQQGIGTLRLSFPGSGESEGEFSDVSCKVWGEVGVRIFGYARTISGVDPAAMGLLGMSLGGAAAVLASKELSLQVKTLILLAPAFEYAVKYQDLFGDEDKAYRGNLMIRRHFVQDEASADFKAALEAFPNPVRFIHGAEDTSVSPEVSIKYAEYPKNRQLILIPGANHAFDDHLALAMLETAVLQAAAGLKSVNGIQAQETPW